MTTRKHRRAIPSSRAFEALNEIENALVDAETSMALFSAMVDNDIDDTACMSAIERHLSADMAALRAAFKKAHADTFQTDGGAA